MDFVGTKTLLLEIDVQNDFCPKDGALAVRNGGEVIAPLNALAAAIAAKGGRVAATQDWHPAGHCSFSTWPEHCVQGSRGAALHDRLDLRPVSLIVRKGFRKDLDSYSAFFENDRTTPTGIEGWIRFLGIETVIIGGLATDYCVFYSAMDCKRLGFAAVVVSDAIRGVDIPAGSAEKAIAEMKAAGIAFAGSADLLKELR
jgi:nicotinamidase/pyrazinamidase